MTERPLEPRDVTFFKSTLSNDHQGCVEAGRDEPRDGRWLRKSNDPTTPPHFFTNHEWTCFTAGVKAGEFEADEHSGMIT